MAPNPISMLKKGLAQFSKKIKARKDKLTDMLTKNEKISDNTGWTTKQTQLMNNMFSTSWRLPQTMKRKLEG